MKRATLSRRLLAGAATLALGIGGAIALAAPAQATGEAEPRADVFFKSDCDGVHLKIMANNTNRGWRVTVDGEVWYPAGADLGDIPQSEPPWGLWLSGDDMFSAFIPAGDAEDIMVEWYRSGSQPPTWATKYGSQGQTVTNYHPRSSKRGYDWDESRKCRLITEPEVTPPTCEDPGKISIPEAPEKLPQVFEYKLNGEPVDRGSVHEVGPGTHTVTVHWDDKLLKTFVYEFPEPECPEETTPPDDGEGGGELPETGTSVILVAGGALVLLTLGGVMFFVARRRRISFTA